MLRLGTRRTGYLTFFSLSRVAEAFNFILEFCVQFSILLRTGFRR